jgi:hypothetical protein
MEAHIIIANSFVTNASLLGFAALYPTYVVVTFYCRNHSSIKRQQCIKREMKDALSGAAYQWIRSTDKVFVADKGASKGATVFVNVRLNGKPKTTRPPIHD